MTRLKVFRQAFSRASFPPSIGPRFVGVSNVPDITPTSTPEVLETSFFAQKDRSTVYKFVSDCLDMMFLTR